MKKTLILGLALGSVISCSANVLIDAKLETGVAFNSANGQEILASFIINNKNCIGIGRVYEHEAINTKINFNYAICGEKKYKMRGFFYDSEKMLGAKRVENKNKKFVKIEPQSGYIALIDFEELRISKTNTCVKGN